MVLYGILHSKLFHYQNPTYFAFMLVLFSMNNNSRLPTLQIWQAPLEARQLSTLPPSWASLCLLHSCNTCCIIKYSRHSTNPLSSEGAPPGANGHPVPITYEGFNLLTDNYNNYFMSSFIPQVNRIWKLKIISSLSSTTTWREAARPTRSNWSFCRTGFKLTSFSGGQCLLGMIYILIWLPFLDGTSAPQAWPSFYFHISQHCLAKWCHHLGNWGWNIAWKNCGLIFPLTAMPQLTINRRSYRK